MQLTTLKMAATQKSEYALKIYGLYATVIRHAKKLSFYTELHTIHARAVHIQKLIDGLTREIQKELENEEQLRAQAREAEIKEHIDAIISKAIEQATSIKEQERTKTKLSLIHRERARALQSELEFIIQKAPTTQHQGTLEAWLRTVEAFEKELEQYEDKGHLGALLLRAKEALHKKLALY